MMKSKCHVAPIQKLVTSEEQAKVKTISLAVWGMGCTNCAMRVRNSLISLHGVTEAAVDHVQATAQVTFNPDLVTVFDLADAVANAGNDGKHRYVALSVID